jgi:sorbitol/mannitol transport system permease protein
MHAGMFSRTFMSLLAWIVALVMFFPIAWTILTSFKTENSAIDASGLLHFQPTLASYAEVFARAAYFEYAINSIIVSVGATLLVIILAVPAAYSMAFHPTRSTRGLLLWMLSTKMLPPVGVLMPMYIIFRSMGMLDTRSGLILIDTLLNLPLAVWMLFTFFKEIPRDILEAGRMDGARVADEIRHLLLPLALPGLASTSLLSLIFCWNEAFWSLTLTASAAAPLTAFIASFSSPEGLFFAKLSAASTVAFAPILALGWLGQRRLVRGLTFGAVK